ncbi:hypothetical protein J4G43_004940 [Bradyrhizobium barranii subsp. barranii]|uniref:Uncharacterized protein n=1 Tax=Bradyrhizobium barranii subsp. barranii TaxID=2823807 RepID=A0A939S0P8_9BRAD|nr:hypothetical protein [Bradyrhizobium barranii]UEM13670.1 hypothetical protein J4G43_004940 [Bradyrhizobium barranii subsp. barranii]
MTFNRPMFPPVTGHCRAFACKGAFDASHHASGAPEPAWQRAVIRLANVGERVCERLGWVLEHNQDNDPNSEYAENCRELVEMLIEYLDGIEVDPDLEDGGCAGPSLRSHEIEPAGPVVLHLPSRDRVAGYDVEEQSEDEGVTA